jgi:hypothetical protein
MTRRIAIAVPLTAVAVAGAVLAPGTFGQAGAAPATVTLEMRHKEARVTMIDESPRMTRRRRSESPGDSVVTRGTLRDAAGARAGVVHGQFVVTGGRSPDTTEQVTATFVLAGGQLAAQGVIDQEGASEVLPIVGGTGRFDGATGTVEISGNDQAVRFVVRPRA